MGSVFFFAENFLVLPYGAGSARSCGRLESGGARRQPVLDKKNLKQAQS